MQDIKLSCSGTHKWLICTLSPHLEQKANFIQNNNSATIGTLIHEFAERELKFLTTGVRKQDNKFYPAISNEILPVYIDYIKELSNNFSDRIFVEYRLSLNNYVPSLFGTADCIVINKQGNNLNLHVVDLKTGRNPISAKQNPQIASYMLGLYDLYKHRKENIKIFGHIVQPVIKKNSVIEMSKEELENFGELLKTQYNNILTNPQVLAGSHCSKYYCKGRFNCKAYKEYVETPLKDIEAKDFYELDEEEIKNIIDFGSEYSKWINGVIQNVKQLMVDNKLNLSGYKVNVVNKRSYISDKAKLISYFASVGIPEEVYMTYDITPISKLEKCISKEQMEKLNEVIETKQHLITLKKIKNKE